MSINDSEPGRIFAPRGSFVLITSLCQAVETCMRPAEPPCLYQAREDPLNYLLCLDTEPVGKAEETIDPPPSVRTNNVLIQWLVARCEEYAHAFEKPVARAAVDHIHAKLDATVVGAGEIAFFPPTTRRVMHTTL
jgi:molybdopterin synthase sulfur carrier subunit